MWQEQISLAERPKASHFSDKSLCQQGDYFGHQRADPAVPSRGCCRNALEFPDNRLLIDLCGEFDRNLAQVEHQMGVHVLRRGNRLAVIGDKAAREQAAAVLRGALCAAGSRRR